jgi:3-oxoacyl-[acyl-carrier protein] reductase
MTLEGKTALVTGSSKGLGRSILLRLAARGANVVVNYSRDEKAAADVRAAAEAFGVRVLTVAADVSKVDEIERLFAAAKEEFGQIDIVVANAGMEKVNIPVVDVTEEDFDLLFRVNTKGPYFVMQAAARHIADNGRIINISSNSTTLPQEGLGLYGTSKAAPKYLVRVLALELGARQISVNSIVPGPIDGAGIFTGVGDDDPYKKSLLAAVPIGRLGSPQDVADVTEFLTSDGALFVTGQEIVMDGGMH